MNRFKVGVMPRGGCITLACAGVVAWCSGSALHADLVGHWPLDLVKGAVVPDVAGSNPGIALGQAHVVRGGVAGNAMRFTIATNDHVTIGNVFQFAGSTPFTLSVWVKPDPGVAVNLLFMTKHTAGFPNGWILFSNVSGGCYGEIDRTTFYTNDGCGTDVTATTLMADGEWHHVAAVCAPGSGRFVWVDGGAPEGVGATHSIGNTAAPLVFGGVFAGGNSVGSYSGLLDDIQIYDHALNCAEVNWLHDHPGEPLGNVYDLTGDGIVDGADLGQLLSNWGPCRGADPCATADFDCDGQIGGADLGALLSHWSG